MSGVESLTEFSKVLKFWETNIFVYFPVYSYQDGSDLRLAAVCLVVHLLIGYLFSQLIFVDSYVQ